MLAAIRHNLRNLANFSGRDARQTFWFYVLFLFIVYMVVSMLVTIPVMVSAMSGAFEGAQSGMSEQAMQARIVDEMGGIMDVSVTLGLVASLAMVVLLAASFVRRIHDSGHSGWWALLAVVPQVAAAIHMFTIADEMREFMVMAIDPSRAEEMLARQQELMAFGLIGYIPLIVIVVFGVMRSTDGANRYGEEPVAD